MADSDQFQIPPEQEQLHAILMKILMYQHSLPAGRAVEMDELCRERVLSASDVEFLAKHSVTYKPHRISDYHASDMLHMPTDGGCVFVGPSGPPLTKRSALLSAFQPVVSSFLQLPRPEDELLLHIEFTDHDGMAVGPDIICFNLEGLLWRQRLPAIRSVAAEFGFQPFQDNETQGTWTLSFRITPDVLRTPLMVMALLNRGCGLDSDTMISYSAGALDEA